MTARRRLGVALVVAGVASSGAWAADPPARSRTGTVAPPAAAKPPADATPAAVAGTRSIAAADVARVERRIDGPPSTTIWQARLPDGTLELTDRPPTASGATAVQSRSYALPADGAARQRADSERAYWRKQAEAFEARRRERDREQAAEVPRAVVVHTEVHRPAVYHGYGWLPPEIVGPGTGTGIGPGVSPVYVTTPGAAQGRGGGFIGSGFGTAR